MSFSARMKQERTVSVLITDESGNSKWVLARPYQKDAALAFLDEAVSFRRILDEYERRRFLLEDVQFSTKPLKKLFELRHGHFWIEECISSSNNCTQNELILIREDNTRMRMIIHHTFNHPVINENGVTILMPSQ